MRAKQPVELLTEPSPNAEEEADPEWMDIDVNQLDNEKVEFKALPGKKPKETKVEQSNPDTLVEDLKNMLSLEKSPERVPKIFEDSEQIVQSNMRDLLEQDDSLSSDSPRSAEKTVEISQISAQNYKKHLSQDGQVFNPLFINHHFPMGQPILMRYPVPNQYLYSEMKDNPFPSSFLENPENIIMKNLFKPSWLIKKKDRVIDQKQSLELLDFLESSQKERRNLNLYWISDLDTDIHFKPQIILESLREMRTAMKEQIEENKKRTAFAEKSYVPVGFYPVPPMNVPVGVAKPGF